MCIFYVKQFLEGIPVLIFSNPSESTDQCTPPLPREKPCHSWCENLFMLNVSRKKRIQK